MVRKINKFLLIGLFLTFLGAIVLPVSNAYAVIDGPGVAPGSSTSTSPNSVSKDGSVNCSDPAVAANSGRCGTCTLDNSKLCGTCSAQTTNNAAYTCGDKTTCIGDQCNFVQKYINPAINLFSAAVGLVAIIAIIIAGIQYSTSAGDPQKAANAKSRITKAVIAIVAYLFLYGFLQFIVPGGIANK